MANIIVNPLPVSLSKDPILATIGTDYVSPVYAKAVLVFTGVANQNSFTIAWGSRSETIVFKTVADIGGSNELVTPSNGFDETYLNYVLAVLQSNDRLSQDFRIQVTPTGANMRIEFRAWSFDPLTITVTTSPDPLSTVTKTITNSTGPYTKPNLSALLTVNDSGTGKEALRLTQPYQIFPLSTTEKGNSVFDIKAAFNLKPHLPQDFIIERDIASAAFSSYFIRYADRYGAIPIAEAMKKTDNFYAVYGSKNETDTWSPNTEGYHICHAPVAATITTHQAAWVYLFTPSVIDSSENFVYVNLHLNNGTSNEYLLDTPFSLLPNTLYFFRADYDFLQVETFCTALSINPKNVIGYDFRLKNATGVTKASRAFTLQRQNDCNAIQLAFDNGTGGIDTVTMHPRYVRKIDVERSTLQLEGSNVERINKAEAKKIWELKTDLVTQEYAERLAQMLMGDVWIIDKEHNKFIRLIADTKSLEIKPTRGKVQLSISFKSATTYKKI
jgi:hypothetical protein